MTSPGAPPEAAALAACARGEVPLATALGIRPEAIAAARELAWRVAAAGRHDLARTLLEGVVALAPDDAWAHRALAGLALHRGDASAALASSSQALHLAHARGARDAEASLLLARAHIARGDPSAALPHLEIAAASTATGATARALTRRLGQR